MENTFERAVGLLPLPVVTAMYDEFVAVLKDDDAPESDKRTAQLCLTLMADVFHYRGQSLVKRVAGQHRQWTQEAMER
jgi:hypothetical protein